MSKVKLVGVGPGHPGLATVQAVEAIKDADVIRHSDGCGVGLLHLAAATADVGPFQSTDEIVRRSGAPQRALESAQHYASTASRQLDAIAATDVRDALAALAGYVVSRKL